MNEFEYWAGQSYFEIFEKGADGLKKIVFHLLNIIKLHDIDYFTFTYQQRRSAEEKNGNKLEKKFERH